MNTKQLGYLGQGIFNILRRYVKDQKLRWNITERVMDLIVLILDENKAKRLLDAYNRNADNDITDDIGDHQTEQEIQGKTEGLVRRSASDEGEE